MLDSCGSSGTGETPQACNAEEAQRPPRGKRALGAEINRPISRLNKKLPRKILFLDNLKGKHIICLPF
ncbi:hypothetical protein B1NLA3E_05415 [Bacillus sp. 1NLA3E]|nr:hypothetical protein B1NLA3E_05415 [Bacillus sp. 1NLA3E]